MEPTDSLWRRWIRLWIWGFAAYTLLALLYSTQVGVQLARQGQAVNWSAIVTNHLLDNWGAALLVPVFFLLVRRFPLDREHWLRSTPVLLAVALACVLIKCLYYEPFVLGLVSADVPDFDSHLYGEMFDMAVIIVVAQAFEFHRRAKEREKQALLLREQLTHAQLDALRSQLHPHFLFNTLNGAATLMHSDVAAADRMLTELSELLRATLAYSGTHEIPLADELALLDRYLSIMKVRFRDRLTVSVEAEGDVRRGYVPAFLLQPLVENALEHGIGARPGPGRLDVKVARENGRMRITITDDGPGPGREAVPGVGIANTSERLVQLYGDAQELSLSAAATGQGAEVSVSLPWRTAPTAS